MGDNSGIGLERIPQNQKLSKFAYWEIAVCKFSTDMFTCKDKWTNEFDMFISISDW